MSRDVTWTAREIRVLRKIQNMSQRAFAQHLGYAQSTVANWENARRDIALHHETREVLDRELAGLPTALRDSFDRQLDMAPGALGVGSVARTTALLDWLNTVTDAPLPYHPPGRTIDEFDDFLKSSARVFLLSGGAGTGKSRLTRHVAGQHAGRVDIQLLEIGNWDLAGVDVTAEILRYASIPRGNDALLTLESHCTQLQRVCLVVIDGLTSHHDFSVVGRQVDAILRQVTTHSLRFLLTIRTPPAIETTALPMLHATTFRPGGARRTAQRTELAPWERAEARSHWDSARPPHAPPFDRLPTAIRHLVRTPVYMRLALTASLDLPGHGLNTYTLIDRCLRVHIGAASIDPEQLYPTLTRLACQQSHDLLPSTITAATPHSPTESPTPPALPTNVASTIVRNGTRGRAEFTHDILREFFVGTRIADLVHAQGRSLTTVATINELAERAATSSAARSVVELTLQALDDLDPELLAAIATAPTASTTSTIPLMLKLADNAQFATPELLRSYARRAELDAPIDLSQAMLSSKAVHNALGSSRTQWVLTLLRRFGTALWPHLAEFIEYTFDAADAYALQDTADLANSDEATFFARHFPLFIADTTKRSVEPFLSHPNWRVRAALAEALGDDHVPIGTAGLIVMARLVRDADYKVRAAIAPALTRAPAEIAQQHLTALLFDDNWHVRDRTLQGLDRPAHLQHELVVAALTAIHTDTSWHRCPAHVRTRWQRLNLLHTDDAAGIPDASNASPDEHRALFTVLREIRTEHLRPPTTQRESIVERGRRSGSWLVRREAERAAATGDTSDGTDPRLSRERFRRARGHRAIQIALDMHTLSDAITVARAAAAAGADLIEVGDPLIKEVGIHAVEQVKAAVPDTTVVAEMMSADWGRDQVVLAAQAGADVVQLIGPATTASVSAAVDAGQRLGVPILLDTSTHTTHHWITDMERAGVDGFTVTTNIDLGIGNTTPLDAAHTLRSWTQLPVAVSGGFSASDHAVFASSDWDILIIGRSVADAIDTAIAATRIVDLARHTERHR